MPPEPRIITTNHRKKVGDKWEFEEIEVPLVCPTCGGHEFTMMYSGYAWFDLSLDTGATVDDEPGWDENDSETGDDWEPSDNGWSCDACGDYMENDSPIHDALTEFLEILQTAHDPARQAQALLSHVQIIGDAPG
jgi:rubredoxin